MIDAVTPKDLARTDFLRRRRDLPPDALQAAGQALAARALRVVPDLVPAGSTVAGYLSAGREPATGALLTGLHEQGYDVVVPVCEPGRRLSWCRWSPGVPLVPGLFPSVPEPAGRRMPVQELTELRLMFIPALAVDRDGVRLGKGGGYYDRFLADLRSAGNSIPSVGVVYDHEFVPARSWVSDSLDQPVSAVLTPSQWTGLPARPVYS